MAISLDYGTMQKQIADELGDRQDLLVPLSDSTLTLSPIQNAIQSAIAKYERERFYFNDLQIKTPLTGPYPWMTVLGQEYYGDHDWTNPNLSSVASIKEMWVFVNQNRYEMFPRTAEYIAGISVNPAVVGYPTDYSYTGQQIRFYPIPDGNYPIGVLGTKRFDPLVNTTDSNAWTQDAYDLIRTEAKMLLARGVLYDEEVESACSRDLYGDGNSSSRGYIYALKGETTRRVGMGRVIPTYF